MKYPLVRNFRQFAYFPLVCVPLPGLLIASFLVTPSPVSSAQRVPVKHGNGVTRQGFFPVRHLATVGLGLYFMSRWLLWVANEITISYKQGEVETELNLGGESEPKNSGLRQEIHNFGAT